MAKGRAGFTLIELLVVVAIIALLVSILLPSLSRARAQAAATQCKAHMHHMGVGFVTYNSQNNGFNVPSYNLPSVGSAMNYTGGPDKKMDGWASILDRDGVVPTVEQDTNTLFYCPRTADVNGMAGGQTGFDPRKPRGWVDWPLRFLSVGGDSSPKQAVKIPERGFNKIIRVAYWLNAYNPIGKQPSDLRKQDVHYTSSVGLGPDGRGQYIKPRLMRARRPSLLIVASDGIYMGRQRVPRLGDENSRIGYRHPGMGRPDGAANVALADGHVETVAGDQFPRAVQSGDTAEVIAEKKLENVSGLTVYEDPERFFE